MAEKMTTRDARGRLDIAGFIPAEPGWWNWGWGYIFGGSTLTKAHWTPARRTFRYAVVLALTLYVPVLWPVLVISVAMVRWNDTGRGLHDLAGGTLVVADPRLDPEHQRQLAMRMRIGRAV